MSGKTNGSFMRQVAFTRSVTPSNSDPLPGGVTRGIHVNESGDVAVVYTNGMEDILTLQGGMIHPYQVLQIKASGTTATGIKACY